MDKVNQENELKSVLKSVNRDKEELAIQLSSIDEKCQKLEMDRD